MKTGMIKCMTGPLTTSKIKLMVNGMGIYTGTVQWQIRLKAPCGKAHSICQEHY